MGKRGEHCKEGTERQEGESAARRRGRDEERRAWQGALEGRALLGGVSVARRGDCASGSLPQLHVTCTLAQHQKLLLMHICDVSQHLLRSYMLRGPSSYSDIQCCTNPPLPQYSRGSMRK